MPVVVNEAADQMTLTDTSTKGCKMHSAFEHSRRLPRQAETVGYRVKWRFVDRNMQEITGGQAWQPRSLGECASCRWIPRQLPPAVVWVEVSPCARLYIKQACPLGPPQSSTPAI